MVTSAQFNDPPESIACCRDVLTQLQQFSGSDNRLINLSAELLAILMTLAMANSSPNVNSGRATIQHIDPWQL